MKGISCLRTSHTMGLFSWNSFTLKGSVYFFSNVLDNRQGGANASILLLKSSDPYQSPSFKHRGSIYRRVFNSREFMCLENIGETSRFRSANIFQPTKVPYTDFAAMHFLSQPNPHALAPYLSEDYDIRYLIKLFDIIIRNLIYQ